MSADSNVPGRWVEENHDDQYRFGFRVTKELFSGQSDFQKVEVVETAGHGKMLLNDGLVMVSERDEFVYHDMMAHVPLFTHPDPKRVLVIGGGDGGTAREVLRHPYVEHCRMVEIDDMVVESCRQHIPLTSSVFDHPKLQLDIADGVKFLAETDEKYDVILIDSTDPIGPAAPLFGTDFYKNVYRALTDEGIVVAQAENGFYEQEAQVALVKIVSELFPICRLYNYSNLTYPGGLWSFLLSSKKFHPVKDFVPDRVTSSGLDFKYYNEDIHRASFAQPSFIRKAVAPYLKDGAQ